MVKIQNNKFIVKTLSNIELLKILGNKFIARSRKAEISSSSEGVADIISGRRFY